MHSSGETRQRFLGDECVSPELNAAVFDDRPRNNNTEHPLRQVSDLVRRFHPELPTSIEIRNVLCDVSDNWISRHQSEDGCWEVFGTVAAAILTPRRSAMISVPGKIHSYQLIETVLEPGEMDDVHKTMWSQICDRAQRDKRAVKALIDVAADWMRAGSGRDAPFGQAHSAAQVKKARAIGRKMLQDLSNIVSVSPGLGAYLRDVAAMFNMRLPVQISEPYAQFLISRRGLRAGSARSSTFRRQVETVVAPWAQEPPSAVLARLFDIKQEITFAGQSDAGIYFACEFLADTVDDPQSWFSVAACQELAEGVSFLHGALTKAAVASEHVEVALRNKTMRGGCVTTILSHPNSTLALQKLVLESLTDGDGWAIEWLFVGDGIDDSTLVRWLNMASSEGRGRLAASVFYGKRRDTDWRPSKALAAAWFDALRFFRPNGESEYETTELFGFMARNYPDALVELVFSAVSEIDPGGIDDPFPYAAWRVLREIPSAHKLVLWRRCGFNKDIQRHVQNSLFPGDFTSMDTLLNSGDLTAEDVLEISGDFGGPRMYELLAPLLVPRGIRPERIASMAHTGSWTGEESDRYASIVEQFARYAESKDASVAAVGSAGVKMFTKSREDALRRERLERVRGYE